MKKRYLFLAVCLALGVYSCNESSLLDSGIDDDPDPTPRGPSTCTSEATGEQFDCKDIDLLALLSPSDLLGDGVNDIWGWTDPENGREYALVGMTDGVTIVDVTDPAAPVVLGSLTESAPASVAGGGSRAPTPLLLHDDEEEGEKSSWRDLKVYNNHLFVVSDGQPHGMQVFDLTRLRNVQDPPVIFDHDFLYTEFGRAHNIAVNASTGYAYVVGSDTYGGGLHIIDLTNPLDPVFAGFHADSTVGRASTGYVHDTQCVNYTGPDNEYNGREVCFNSSETHLVIADVSNKDSTYTIAKSSYAGRSYAHQGWLTEDQQYFLLGDELDENRLGINTRTYIWDVSDLDNPTMIGTNDATTSSIDHNLYVKGSYVYQSNYTSGLRILDISDIQNGNLEEVAYFDTHPEDDTPQFDGSWSNYPYFQSGTVIVSDMSRGLFILRPQLP